MRIKMDLRNCDCVDLMKEFPDKHFELAIVDPPYFEDYGKEIYPGSKISTTGIKRNRFHSKFWNVPDEKYFNELFRVSKNQIIWGCNYYAKFIPFVGRIVWDKQNDLSSFSKAEIAAKSINIGVDMFRYMWNGMLQGDMKNKEERVHPTQKPVALYKWLLQNYAKKGDKILDTHLGSMSSVIACYDEKFDITGSELDPDYFKAGMERVKKHTSQVRLDDLI
jgi:site-specific DNA-methyltransferase (adenine-specific)